ncbi:MAG: hypothetical protein NTX04_02675 [Verrucomicrobia bacterium]|nr:hypothetical protein [Verrucomicrobiota bacterium]
METNQPEDPTSTELTPETFSANFEGTPKLIIEEASPGLNGDETPPLGEVFEVPPVAPVVEVMEAQTSGGDALNKEAVPLDEIGQLAEASARARLVPAEEERLTILLKEAILGGRSGVSRAVEMLPKVPWIVGVRAIEQVWVDLTSGFRTQLLSGLGKEDSDAARRMRLSVARALFKIDPAVTIRLIGLVLREMRDKDKSEDKVAGMLTLRHAQTFSNVLIGRGKPWVALLPLGDFKPGDADLLVHCALSAVFTVPHPPLAQMGILHWASQSGRLGKLPTESMDLVKKGISRWSGKWRNSLRKEVPELPAVLLEMLPAEGGGELEASPAIVVSEALVVGDSPVEVGEGVKEEGNGSVEGRREEVAVVPKKERPVYEPRAQKGPRMEEPRREREGGREREGARERAPYEPRNAGGGNNGGRFDLATALRQIEQHVQGLRSELVAAQSKPRVRDEERRSSRLDKVGPLIEGAPTPEELARLNLQLEARNLELQSQITELRQHSEDLAASSGAISGQPVDDLAAQLRALLGLKLQEDYADFLALEKESNDLVVQQHYKGLIRHVFEMLVQLGVPLAAE